MQNKLMDLNNHLFAQLERLNEEGISQDKLKMEIDRSKAVTSISQTIINNAQLALDAEVAIKEWQIKAAPAMIGYQKV